MLKDFSVVHTSQLDILNNRIESMVTQNTFDNRIGEIVQSLQSLVSQTASSLTIKFTEQTANATSPLQSAINTLQSYIRATASGLEIGKSSSPFITRLTNDKLSFLQNGNEVAYISNNKMYITEAQITNKLVMGTGDTGLFEWVTNTNGLGLRWRG
jgi:hypothetical protein